MAKKNRKNEAVTPKSVKKPLNVRLVIAVVLAAFLSTVVYFGLAELSVALSEKAGEQIYIPVMEIYTILTAIFICATVVVNAGMRRGEMPTEADLPDDWSPERKAKFIESVPKRKKAVKVLSLIIIALIVPIFCELTVWWFDVIKGWFAT